MDLTHFNRNGEAHMVDVGDKKASHRLAVAAGMIRMEPDTLKMITEGAHKKGDVLGVARIAGIMAAKKTADLIPLCHPLALTRVEIELKPSDDAVHCIARVETRGQTGVEMEALNATQVALLTIYETCARQSTGAWSSTRCACSKSMAADRAAGRGSDNGQRPVAALLSLRDSFFLIASR